MNRSNILKSTFALFLVIIFSSSRSVARGPLQCRALFGLSLEQELPSSFNVFVQRKLSNGYTLTLVDGAKFPSGPSFPMNLKNAYEGFKSKIYEDRLAKDFNKGQELTPKQIAEKAELARNLERRSIFIFITKVDPKIESPVFKGGFQVVFSRSVYEKMPFELDEDLNQQREPYSGQSVEFKSLVVVPEDDEVPNNRALDAENTKLLVSVGIQAALTYGPPQLNTGYVHTSKGHLRMYRILKMKPEKVYDKGPLDQLLVFSAEQMRNFVKYGSVSGPEEPAQ